MHIHAPCCPCMMRAALGNICMLWLRSTADEAQFTFQVYHSVWTLPGFRASDRLNRTTSELSPIRTCQGFQDPARCPYCCTSSCIGCKGTDAFLEAQGVAHESHIVPVTDFAGGCAAVSLGNDSDAVSAAAAPTTLV